MHFLYMIWPARPKVAVIFPELSFGALLNDRAGLEKAQ